MKQQNLEVLQEKKETTQKKLYFSKIEFYTMNVVIEAAEIEGITHYPLRARRGLAGKLWDALRWRKITEICCRYAEHVS